VRNEKKIAVGNCYTQ